MTPAALAKIALSLDGMVGARHLPSQTLQDLLRLLQSLKVGWEAADYESAFNVRVAQNHEALRDRLLADGGVRRAALGVNLPGVKGSSRTVVLGGDDATGERGREGMDMAYVHHDYFRE
jgi:hypothetical protein